MSETLRVIARRDERCGRVVVVQLETSVEERGVEKRL